LKTPLNPIKNPIKSLFKKLGLGGIQWLSLHVPSTEYKAIALATRVHHIHRGSHLGGQDDEGVPHGKIHRRRGETMGKYEKPREKS